MIQIEPSSFASGCAPEATSTIARRRNAKPAPGSASRPPSSGPRWRRSSAAWSSHSRSGIRPSGWWYAAKPHMTAPLLRGPRRGRDASGTGTTGSATRLADPRPVSDVRLAEPAPAQDRLELDLLRERHAVRRHAQPLEDRPAEHPHARLAVPDRLEEEQHRGRRQDPVAELVRDAHRGLVREREPAGGEEVPALRDERVDELRDRLGRVRAVAVERHDDVAGRGREAGLVRGAITRTLLGDDARSERARDLRRSVGAVVVHDDDLVDVRRAAPDDFADAVLLVVAGDDEGQLECMAHAGFRARAPGRGPQG